jgi:hypothetical protein
MVTQINTMAVSGDDINEQSVAIRGWEFLL